MTLFSKSILCLGICGMWIGATTLSFGLAPQLVPGGKAAVAAPKNAVASAAPRSQPPDCSKEAFVIQKFDSNYNYRSDGTWDATVTAAVRVQSQAGIQQFGNLSIPYEAANQKVEISYLRVRKPDGTVVATPATNIQDVPAGITVQAPMYSDVHIKQIPVTDLNPGDTLEYQFRLIENHAETPNQFWLAANFITQGIVLDERVEIRVPKKKYVKVVSASVQPTVHQDGGEIVYEWRSSHLHDAELDSTKDATKKAAADSKPSIQLTTFQSWQQLGEWYRTLQADRVVVTPAIQKQEQQIVQGLTTDDAKQRAIYAYVSTQFRYIGLSFGIGRLQPHTADTVLQNKFGDCKDKHTLFAALMQAAGYQVWPALMGSSTKLDPDVPSPVQFDHMISVLPQGKNLVWLDTTEEVAPFGMLMSPLRDKQALVIPAAGAPELKKTPADPPFPEADTFSMKATLDNKAVLTGHADLKARGDLELLLRAAFHATPQGGWTKLGQNVSYMFGYAGDVSNLQADNPDDTSKPFDMQYDYVRKDYGGSDGKQISPPLLPIPFLLGETSKQPEDWIPLGALGEHDDRATVELPKGDTATLVADKELQTDFAEYRETSSVKDGALIAERFYKVKTSKLPAARWDDYLKFEKAVLARENLMVQLATSSANTPAIGISDNPKAYELLQQAYQGLGKHKINDVENALQQAQKLNPTQWDLWRMYSMLDTLQNKPQAAINSLYKEVANHPDNTQANMMLGMELMHRKQYAEAVIFIKKAADSNDGTPETRTLLGEAELKARQQEAGIADLEKVMRTAQKPITINNAAYDLAVQNADLTEAQRYAQKALDQMETASGKITLAALTNDDLIHVSNIADTWDTIGWLAFRQGRDAEAEKYVQAAWTLNQRGSEADHLGQVYEKQSRPTQAAAMYRLALAAGGLEDTASTQERLDALKQSEVATHKPADLHQDASAADLVKLRTLPMPGVPKRFAFAEFWLLIGPRGIEDVRFIKGVESLRSATGILRKADYREVFPDSGPEKIARRGVFSCFADTAQCEFVLLLPQSTRIN